MTKAGGAVKGGREAGGFGSRVATRVKERREYLGIPREDVALVLGFSVQGYNHLERGRTPFKMSHLPILADILKVPITYLLDEDGVDSFVAGFSGRRYQVIDVETLQPVRMGVEEQELLGRLMDMIQRK